MDENRLSKIRIVLVGTTHPGNIGATARAMKTMGLSRLVLVQPRRFPDPEAVARASGADDILEQVMICDSLSEALSGCGVIVATTARRRSLEWPVSEPRQIASELISATAANQCALVFGREQSGLTNKELTHCQSAVMIPTNPEYRSLNLAAAVQIMTYELNLAARNAERSAEQTAERATAAEMERFYQHLEEAMIESGFYNPEKPKKLIPRMHRLFNRAGLDHTEVQMLRGFFTAIQKTARRKD